MARSGLASAALLAMHLHLPLYVLDQAGHVRDAGHGWRLSRRGRLAKGPALIVDDTVGSGMSLSRTIPIAKRRFPELLYATTT